MDKKYPYMKLCRELTKYRNNHEKEMSNGQTQADIARLGVIEVVKEYTTYIESELESREQYEVPVFYYELFRKVKRDIARTDAKDYGRITALIYIRTLIRDKKDNLTDR